MNTKTILIVGAVAAGVFLLLARKPRRPAGSLAIENTDGEVLFLKPSADGWLVDQNGGKWT